MSMDNGIGEKFANQARELYTWKKIEKPAIKRMLKGFKKINKVLDIGCGDGRVFPLYKDVGVKEENIYGVDIDPKLINIAKGDFPKANLTVGDIKKPINPGDNFDLIISIHVLHYFDKKQLDRILMNVNKLLKNKGTFAFIVAHPIRWVADDLSRYFFREKKVIETPWGTHMNIVCNTLSDYTNTLTENGFVIKQIEELVPVNSGKKDSEMYHKYTMVPSRLLMVGEKWA